MSVTAILKNLVGKRNPVLALIFETLENNPSNHDSLHLPKVANGSTKECKAI